MNDRIVYLNNTIQALSIIKGEKITATREARIVQQINENINRYLINFPVQDKKIINFIEQIRLIQQRLYGDVVTEISELNQKEAILDKERKETEAEKAA